MGPQRCGDVVSRPVQPAWRRAERTAQYERVLRAVRMDEAPDAHSVAKRLRRTTGKPWALHTVRRHLLDALGEGHAERTQAEPDTTWSAADTWALTEAGHARAAQCAATRKGRAACRR